MEGTKEPLIFEGNFHFKLILPLDKEWAKKNDYKRSLEYALILGRDDNSELYVPIHLINKGSGLHVPQYFNKYADGIYVSLKEVRKKMPILDVHDFSNDADYKKLKLLEKDINLLYLENFNVVMKKSHPNYIEARFKGVHTLNEEKSSFTIRLKGESNELINKLAKVYNSQPVFSIEKIVYESFLK